MKTPRTNLLKTVPARELLCLLVVAPLLLAGIDITTTAAPLQLLSARNTLNPLPAGGDGNSVTPVISADGRFVLFSSSANDLVPGDNNQLGLDVFIRDRWSNSTVLVSTNFAGFGGGNGNSVSSTISTNGQFVVFQSDSSDLMAGDTNGTTDIFVRDLQGGTTELISVAADGSWGNDPSTDPVMTPDGRYVAFVSEASNLVPGDTNGIADVFVRDTVAGTTTLVSEGAQTFSTSVYASIIMSTPVITPDGRYVAFSSTGTNLVPGQRTTLGDVYLRDLLAGTTTWVSSNAPAMASSNNIKVASSSHPVMSSDGRFVTFKCGGTNGAGSVLILQYDATSSNTTVIATNGFPAWNYNDDLYGPEATPDGRFIVYCTVVTNSTGLHSGIHLWDTQLATDTLISQDMNGNTVTNATSRGPVVSPDGRFVAFLSNATNLVANVVSNGYHAYIRDTIAGTTQLVDADTNGVGSVNINGTALSMSSNGQFVAFSSPDGSLVSGDNNHALDAFVRDVVDGTNELISRRDATIVPETGNGITSISQLAISSDGRWIAFTSGASDLITNDFNGDSDVFLWDTIGGTNALVSVGLDGNTGSGGYSAWPAISANGRFIAFQSAATNLVANDTNGASDIFLRDMQSGTTILVTVSTNGVYSANNDSWSPSISQDGRYISFLSKATDLTGTAGVIWHDMQSGANVTLPGSITTALTPSMSADGRYVAYSTSSTVFKVWDSVNSSNIVSVTSSSNVSVGLSPNGNRLIYTTALVTGGTTVVLDLILNSNLFTTNTGIELVGPAQWSADGRFVAFTSANKLGPADNNATNDVFLLDLKNETMRVISMNQSGTATGNGPSDQPALSSDGRFVIYRTSATDIVPGIVSVPNIVEYDRLTGSNLLLNAGQPASSWTSWMAKPTVNTNGSTIAFQSWAPGLVAQDMNDVADVFALEQQPWVAIDSDGDGIPDWWMIKYFGHPTGQAGDLSLAQDDADGDGMNNLQEYLAGTDPTDPNSVFRMQITPVGTNGNQSLSWPAVAARSYQIQVTTNLGAPQWVQTPGDTWVVGSQGYLNVTASQPNAFYRVILIP